MATSETGAPEGARDAPPGSVSPAAGADPGVALVLRAQAGDRGAFARLYEHYVSMVHGILISMVPPREALDLVQDVFLSALQSIGGLEKAERFGPWLGSIARNRARDVHRSRRPHELEECSEPAAVQQPARDDEEEAARVLEVLRRLPEAYRETLSLRLVEGLTGPEIAARTGLTHGSVRVNLHRGMKLLRERLEELGRSGGER